MFQGFTAQGVAVDAQDPHNRTHADDAGRGFRSERHLVQLADQQLQEEERETVRRSPAEAGPESERGAFEFKQRASR